MSTTSNELRSTSDALLRDLEALGTLEAEKRSIDPGDERLVDLAAQIEVIAGRVSGSRRQRQLSQEAGELVREGAENSPTASIEDTPRMPTEILAEWREAERRRSTADPGSAEWTESDALVDLLREEYWRAFQRRGS